MEPDPGERREARRPRLRRWARGAAALSLGLIVALGIAEAAVRASGRQVARSAGKSEPLYRMIDDLDLRYELIPGKPRHTYGNPDGTEWVVTYTINRERYRGKLVPLEKPPGVLRIAVIGDSFVFGTGVDDEHTLPRTIERWFEENPVKRRVEVLNFGVPGYEAEQQPTHLERDVLRFDPDIVLYTLYINDAVATTYIGPEPQRFVVDPVQDIPERRWIERLGLTSGIPANTSNLPPAQRRMVALRRASRLADLLADHLFLKLFSSATLKAYAYTWREDGPGWARIREVLTDVREITKREGIQLEVALYPLLEDLEDYPYDEIHQRLARFCAKLGVPFHDLLVPLRGASARSLWAHPHDHHPNATCHGIVGAWLAERMRSSRAGG